MGELPGGAGATIDDMMAQADEIANQLLVSDHATRRRELGNIKNQNEALWAQVKARLQQLEQQSAQQGIEAVRSGQAPPPGQQ